MKQDRIPFGFLDRAAILLFNLLLLILVIVIPALAIASSPGFYRRQFARTGLYSYVDESGETVYHPIRYLNGDYTLTGKFTDAQLDTIADHIIDFCFGDKESFVLVMDDVLVNGEVTDGVSLFGEEAVVHMQDVKALFRLGVVFSWVGSFVLIGLLDYIILRRAALKKLLLKYSVGFYLTLIAIAVLFCLVTVLTKEPYRSFSNQLWRNLHLVFFAFQPEKIEGSFFSDTLTQILTLDLFM